jgi:putative hydrolase of the HAD superfamily
MSFDSSRVDCWIFDLDYTLYPRSTGLFDQIDVKMGEYIAQLLGCPVDEARRIQKDYFHAHGTTLAGLMHHHGVAPHDFLAYVHDIDMAPLALAPRLAHLLDALPGRRILFTNGDESYATKVLGALELGHLWHGMWDIHAMAYAPKPEPQAYAGMIEALDIDPARAVFVEDSARNLVPAKALGMQTVWVDVGTDWGHRGKDDAAIDLVIDDLEQWLASLVGEGKLG